MLLSSFFSPLNIIIILFSIGLIYFHWSLPIIFVVLDFTTFLFLDKYCPLCKKSFAEGLSNSLFLYKRRLVWKKARKFRKTLCNFEELSFNIYSDLQMVNLYGNHAILDNMKSVLIQLQEEFVNELYRHSVTEKNVKKGKQQNRPYCSTTDDLKKSSEQLEFIKKRLQMLNDSIRLAQENQNKIDKLTNAMSHMGQNILDNTNS